MMNGNGFPSQTPPRIRRLNILPLVLVEVAAIVVALAVLSLIDMPILNGLFAGLLCGPGTTLQSNATPIWPDLLCTGTQTSTTDSQTWAVAVITFGVASLFLTPVGVLAAFLMPTRPPTSLPPTPFPTPGVNPATFAATPTNQARVFTAQKYIVDGKTYQSLDELPPEVRQKMQQAMGMLGDANHDGVPDLLQGSMPPMPPASAESGDLAERLRKLDGLRAAGLISEQEYQMKRAQILGEV